MTKTHRVNIRVTEEEMLVLKRLAGEQTISSYMLKLCLKPREVVSLPVAHIMTRAAAEAANEKRTPRFKPKMVKQVQRAYAEVERVADEEHNQEQIEPIF